MEVVVDNHVVVLVLVIVLEVAVDVVVLVSGTAVVVLVAVLVVLPMVVVLSVVVIAVVVVVLFPVVLASNIVVVSPAVVAMSVVVHMEPLPVVVSFCAAASTTRAARKVMHRTRQYDAGAMQPLRSTATTCTSVRQGAAGGGWIVHTLITCRAAQYRIGGGVWHPLIQARRRGGIIDAYAL